MHNNSLFRFMSGMRERYGCCLDVIRRHPGASSALKVLFILTLSVSVGLILITFDSPPAVFGQSEPTCTDNDGGIDYEIASYIEGIGPNGWPYSKYDVCETGDYLGYVKEFYCSGTTPRALRYLCPNGCASGACLTQVCSDADGDGYALEGGSCGLIDCDDTDPYVNPGAAEVCDNGIDDDCDGLVDTADPACPTCTDADGDGYAVEGEACGPVDCNDADPSVNPGATEVCENAIDDDCNGLVDDGCAPPPWPYIDCSQSRIGTLLYTHSETGLSTGSVVAEIEAQAGFDWPGMVGAQVLSDAETYFPQLADWDRAITESSLARLESKADAWTVEYECLGYGSILATGPDPTGSDPADYDSLLYYIPQARALADEHGKCLMLAYDPMHLETAVADKFGSVDPEELEGLVAFMASQADVWVIKIAESVQREYSPGAEFRTVMAQWVSMVRNANPEAKIWVQMAMHELTQQAEPSAEAVLAYREQIVDLVDGIYPLVIYSAESQLPEALEELEATYWYACMQQPPPGQWTDCSQSSFGTMYVRPQEGDWITTGDVLINAFQQDGVLGLASSGMATEETRDLFRQLPGWWRALTGGTLADISTKPPRAIQLGMEQDYECLSYGPERGRRGDAEAREPENSVIAAEAIADGAGKCLIFGPSIRDMEDLALERGLSDPSSIVASCAPHADGWMLNIAKYQFEVDGGSLSMDAFQAWAAGWVGWLKAENANPDIQVWAIMGIASWDPLNNVCLPPPPPEYILEYREALVGAGVDGIMAMPSLTCQYSDNPADREAYLQSLANLEEAIHLACGP